MKSLFLFYLILIFDKYYPFEKSYIDNKIHTNLEFIFSDEIFEDGKVIKKANIT